MTPRALRYGLTALAMVVLVALAALTAAAAPGAAAVGPAAQRPAQPAAQATATPVVICAVRVPRLQIRSGPGTVFPVVGQLTQGTQVRAVSLATRGLPGGRWIEAQLTPGRTLGFVAADIQFVLCRQSLAALPPAKIPPTPRPGPTRTPAPTATRAQLVALVPVAGDLSAAPHLHSHSALNDGALVLIPGADQRATDAALEQDGIIRFDDALVFGVDVFDDRAGTRTGDGIQEVQFDVYYFDEEGNKVPVHFKTERNVPYCVFSDEAGACNVWRFSEHGNRWPGGEPLASDTVFQADITIISRSGDTALWLWKFRMD